MFNPYVALAIGVVLVASHGSAYVSGSRNATNAAKAAQGKALSDAVAAAHAQGVEDMQTELENEARRQELRVEYRDRVQTVERIVREKPSDCRVSDDVFRLLNAAIDAANNPKPTKPSGLPAATEASVKPE